MSTNAAPTPSTIKHRVILPIQTRGNIGKSTEAIARAEWMNVRSVTWQGFDLDKANRTFSATFPEEVRLVELGTEPESDIIAIFRAARKAAVTVIDPQAHQNELLLKALKILQFPSSAAFEAIRVTVLLFPIDEVSDMDDITATVEQLGAGVDWVMVRNPVRQTRTKFFDGSELEQILLKELNAAAITLPALLSDTRNYLRALEVRVGRVITPTEALKNPELTIDLTHRMILETWLREAFLHFDAIAVHLLPPLDAARIQTSAPIVPPEPKKRGRSINLANLE